MQSEMTLRDLAYQTAASLVKQGRWSEREGKQYVEKARNGSLSRDEAERRAEEAGVL